MQPPLTSDELAEMYPDLEPWQGMNLKFGTEDGLQRWWQEMRLPKNIMPRYLLIQILIILKIMKNKLVIYTITLLKTHNIRLFLEIRCNNWVTRELHVKKSVLFFPQINWYDYVSGSTNSRDYRVGVNHRVKV